MIAVRTKRWGGKVLGVLLPGTVMAAAPTAGGGGGFPVDWTWPLICLAIAVGAVVAVLWMARCCRRRVDESSAKSRAAEAEAKESLEALKASEERFRLLFEESADPTWLFDSESRTFVDCNHAAVRMMRARDKRDLVGKSPEQLSPPAQPDGAPSAKRALEIAEEGRRESSQTFEWWARRMDGEVFPMEVSKTTISSGGRVLSLVVSRDVSDRKRIEDELKSTQRRWRLLFEQSPLSIQIIDPTGRTVMVNAAYERLFGLGLEDLARFNILEDAQLETAGIVDYIRRAIAGEVVTVPPMPYSARDNPNLPTSASGPRWIGAVLFPLVGEDGSVREVVFVHNDSTERIETEQALRRGELQFRYLFEASADGILILDPISRRFTECNDAAVSILGGSREWVLSQSPEQLSAEVQPDGERSSDRIRRQIDRALSAGTQRFEWLGRTFGGKPFPMELLLTPVEIGGRRRLMVVCRDISERKREEERIQLSNQELELRVRERTAELKASEDRLRALIENAPDAIVVFNGENARFEICNENACHLYGLTREQLARVGPAEVSPLVQPDGRRSEDAAKEYIGQALAGGTPVFEWTHRHSSGRLLPCEVRLVRLPGDTKLVRGSVVDITERKRRTEQIVRHRNVLLELAQMEKTDLSRSLGAICAAAARTLGVERVGYWRLEPNAAALVCEHMHRAVLGGEDTTIRGIRLAAPHAPSYFRVLSTRQPIVAHDAMTHPASRELGETYLAPLGISSMLDVPVWVHGELVGVLCQEHVGAMREWSPEEIDFVSALGSMVSLSIVGADRARSEQALRESEQKFRTLFETSSHGVLLRDAEKILAVNPATVRLLGYDRAEQLVGRHPSELAPPLQPNGEPSRVASQRRMQECLVNGTAKFEWVAMRRDGAEVDLDITMNRIETKEGWLIQTNVQDVSVRKRAEAELRRALEHERELGALKSRFVSMVSHEFRTPLGIMMSSSNLLRHYFERLSAEERQEQLESIEKNIRRMSDLMEEVLILARFESGKLDFEPRRLEIGSFCRRLADELLSATNRKCPIELALDGADAEGLGDEKLLRHIFGNLVTNAVKYSPQDSPVRLEVQKLGQDAVCRIIDRGIGIPPADQTLLFQAFQRGSNVGNVPGTGLGLTIVKRCVDIHGGEIGVESAEGRGTTVTVRLPLFANAP